MSNGQKHANIHQFMIYMVTMATRGGRGTVDPHHTKVRVVMVSCYMGYVGQFLCDLELYCSKGHM